jgi:hypothetical protein
MKLSSPGNLRWEGEIPKHLRVQNPNPPLKKESLTHREICKNGTSFRVGSYLKDKKRSVSSRNVFSIKKADAQLTTLRPKGCRPTSNWANREMVVHKPVTGTTGRMSWSNTVLVYRKVQRELKGQQLRGVQNSCPI